MIWARAAVGQAALANESPLFVFPLFYILPHTVLTAEQNARKFQGPESCCDTSCDFPLTLQYQRYPTSPPSVIDSSTIVLLIL